MALYNFSEKNLSALEKTTYSKEGLLERKDIQEAIQKNIEVLAPDCLVIFEEFSDWEGCQRRIDLLAIDKQANLVVIELKRDEKGAHMELQAVRYAAMVSTMSFSKACECYQSYIDKKGLNINAKDSILKFVDLDETELIDFGKDVRIVLASADFSKEITTTAIWLRDKGIDIRCVRISPYKFHDNIFINAEQIIPVPELDEYLVKFREKRIEQISSSNKSNKDYSKFIYLGKEYNKRNLMLVTLTHWIKKHNPENLNSLREKLNAVLINHKPDAIILVDQIPEERKKRYHLNEEDTIKLSSGEEVAISTQWGISEVDPVLAFLKEEGFVIEKIEK